MKPAAMTRLRRFVASACDGPFGSAIASEHYVDEGARVVRLGNIGSAEWLDGDAAYLALDYWRRLARHHTRGGDLVVAALGDEKNPVGRAAVVPDLGPAIVKADCHRLRLHPKLANARFLAYYLSNGRGSYEAARVADGSTRKRLTIGKTLGLPVPDLPVIAQRAIADFLDTETARIDALITKKRHLTALLDERRAHLRASAFQGSAGWRLKRVLCAPMAYGVLVPRFVEPGAGTPMIRIGALNLDGTIAVDRLVHIEREQAEEYRRTCVAAGDLVLSVVGSMGRSAVVDAANAGANLNRPLARLRPVAQLPVRLLWHWTQTAQFLDQARLTIGGGTAQPTLNIGDLAEFEIGLPADPATWQLLLDDLDVWLAPIEAARLAIDRQISLLEEHRAALITAAVTGELEVPGVAA